MRFTSMCRGRDIPALIMAVLGGFLGAWLLTYFESRVAA